MLIALAADHNGVELKSRLAEWLTDHGHEADDRGAYASLPHTDYPLLCADVCLQVVHGAAARGVVLGGSGLGETIACNKIRGIRAGLCHDVRGAHISRANNDSNVLVLAAKVLSVRAAEQILAIWLDTPFKGGEHQRRLDQIAALERGAPLT